MRVCRIKNAFALDSFEVQDGYRDLKVMSIALTLLKKHVIIAAFSVSLSDNGGIIKLLNSVLKFLAN